MGPQDRKTTSRQTEEEMDRTLENLCGPTMTQKNYRQKYNIG